MQKMVPTISVLFALFFISVQAQLNVTVTWEGNLVTGPILIYHDEVRFDGNDNPMLGDLDDPGALVCRSQTRPQALWRSPARFAVQTGGDINQIQTGTTPSFARLSRGTTNSPPENFDGLLICRVNTMGDGRDVVVNFNFIGFYNRQLSGAGVITDNNVNIVDMDFSGNSPEFSLRADTSGGPPVEYFWTRSGEPISDDDTFDITLDVTNPRTDSEPNTDILMNSRYNSILVVRGNLPGAYQYTVGNRATSPMVTSSFNIEGAPPTNVMLEQIGISMVRVTWTAPAAPPAMGYWTRVSIGNQMSGNTDGTGTNAQFSLVNGQYGMYVARVMSRSQHLPGQPAESGEVAVLGNLAPDISEASAAATSVTIMWTQPQFSREVTSYTITVTAGDNTGMERCSGYVEDDRIASTQPGVTTTMLAGLKEFREYRVTVLATFTSGFGMTNPTAESSSMDFETLSAAPTMGPREVIATPASRTVQVTWNTIECIHRNGLITDYAVRLQADSGDMVTDGVVDFDAETYMASGLRPFTRYIFQVAGVNSISTGVFTEIDFNTLEDTPGPVFNLTAGPKFISVILEWRIPQEPNGNIIAYQVTYRVGNGNGVTRNTTDLNTRLEIPDVSTNTTVSEITVTAYTTMGRGEESTHPDVVTPVTPEIPVVQNVTAMAFSDTAVRVRWNPLMLTGIVGNRVYYRRTSGSRKRQSMERSVRVEGANSGSTTITGLQGGVQYQFQVVALAGTEEAEGPRSELNSNSMTTTNPPPDDDSSSGSTGAIVGGVVFAIALICIIILVVVVVVCLRRRQQFSKLRSNVDTVRYAKGPGTGALMNMQQHIEPVIEDFPEDTLAIEGEGVVFKVVVSGKPEPTLVWYHTDEQITNDYSREVLDDGSLNLPSLELKQGGVYKMVARNSAGSVEQSVKLTVQFEGEKTPDVERKSMTFAPIPVPEFGEYVVQNHANNNQGFRDQYLALESGDDYPKTIGLSEQFKKLNRFANITNYDHHRIELTPIPDQPDCQREFINGCYIDGYSIPRKFIASQGPIPKTVIDFWRLIWQERPPIIVMVTNLNEGNKKKCEQYWPDSGSSNYGPFKVTLTENQVFADYQIRTMHVSLQGGNRPHKLQQFHFTAWPDHGVPDYATPMLAFYRRIKSSHNPKRGPILVHCSAGVGRTGTFICIDNVLEQIKKEKVVDIAGAINKMRHQRMKMVQTPDQYQFLHDAMLESVTCGDTQITAADLRMKIKKYERVDPATGENTFLSQFKVLEQVSPKISEVICKVAHENPERNRNTAHLPADRFRVLLKGEQPDYIHAVFAHGYKQQKAYIVAEGPMESTARNMLKILYDRKCGAVIMLSGLMENGMESSYKYWPAVGEMSHVGEYTVDLLTEEALEGFTIRSISILDRKTQKPHQVTQFHITCWGPDGQCSNLRSVVDTIDEMSKVQRRTGNRPIFVHCSDTVTRSGMFCALASVVDRCKTEGVVDVFQVVKALRVQKPGAVPTVDNYKTVFDATLTFLDSFDTYANFQNV